MRSRHVRVWAALGSLALVLGLAAPGTASEVPLPTPNSMAALGDSITVAYDSTRLLAASPEHSWATGTSTSVDSVRKQLGVSTKSTRNYAVTGAKMAGLATQAGKVAKGTDLVTVLMGANDACTSSVASMTQVATFRSQVDTALATLAARRVDQVAIVSIPDVHQLWEAAKDVASARFIWSFAGICQSLLADPLSMDADDVARRAAVRDRVVAYNAALAAGCTALDARGGTTACWFDGNEVFDTTFELAHISTVDYFHPSVAGQDLIAEVVHSAGWGTSAKAAA